MELLVFILLIGLGVYYFVKSQEKDKSLTPDEGLDEDLNFAALNSHDIKNATYQILESTYLMANSKNIKTIIGRYEFIEERIESFERANRTQAGKIYIQDGIDRYIDDQNLEDITTYQGNFLFHSDEDARKVFFAKTLLFGFDKHYEYQMAEIADLKMDHAIKNRFNKLEEKLDQVNEIVEDLRHLDEVDKLMRKISLDYKNMESNIRNKQIAE